MRLHAEHSSQASTPLGERQFRAFASSTANSFLPTPSGPVKSKAPGIRRASSIRRNKIFTLEFPASLSNISLLSWQTFDLSSEETERQSLLREREFPRQSRCF